MFELEYLYEQLKSQTVMENYVNVLNTVTEGCYDNIQVSKDIQETMNLIEEASNKNKFTKIDKLRALFTKTEKVLDKYKERALNCKPVGLVYNDYIVSMSDSEIKKLHTQAIKYLTKLNLDKASEDQLQQFILDSNNSVQYWEISEIFGSGKRTFTLPEIIFTKKNKEISKSDIKNAIKYIEDYNKVIKSLQNEMQKVGDEYRDYERVNGIPGMNASGNIENLRRNAKNHQKTLINIADNTYHRMLYVKYEKELKQAKAIVIKAANYNPRNLKESQIMQYHIDSLLEFSEY